MGIFFKREQDYIKAVIKDIFRQTGIFSYQANEGEVKIKFSPFECMHYVETRVKIAELLNYLLRDCDSDNLAAFSAEAYNIIQVMKICAVKDFGRERNLILFKEEALGLSEKHQDGSTNHYLNDLILIETSKEKIERVISGKDESTRIRKIIYLFGSFQEYNELFQKINGGFIEIQRVLPLEYIIGEYLKKY